MKKEEELDPRRKEALRLIKEITEQYPYYGYRRVHAILKHRQNFQMRRNTVYELMKENKLLLPATRSRKQMFKGVPFSVNVGADQSNALWGIDMTYIWCG